MSVWNRVDVKTDRGVFEVFIGGNGPPLCATHGYSVFNQTGDYFGGRLAAFATVYLVNLRGAGGSPSPAEPRDLSMAQAVEDLEAIRTALGFPMWNFAGHSTGGMLGLLYAAAYASSLSSLIVVGAAASRHYNQRADCIYHPDHPQFAQMQQLIESLKKSPTNAERERLTRQRTELSLYHPQHYDRYFDGSSSKQLAAARLEYFSRDDYPTFDVRPALPGVRVPALVVGGRYDVQCPFWCSQEIADLMPHAQLVEFTESNHYPFLEEAEMFDRIASAFLAGIGSGSSQGAD